MTAHWPVLCQEIVQLFSNQTGPLHFVDATFGRGGHTQALLQGIDGARVTAIDRDPDAIAYGHHLVSIYGDRLRMVQSRFSDVQEVFKEERVAGVLFDFGVSSPQLDTPERGFSFMHDGPLDMRMEKAGESAADLVNNLPEHALADLIFKYGEERASRRIAKAIVQFRSKTPFETTEQLSTVVQSVLPRRGKQHPATKTFQALRIAVNQEIDEIEMVLPRVLPLLQPGGCMIVMSFHSLEDRIVKNFFKTSDAFSEKTKKPIRAQRAEVCANPRSRSACLRYGVRAS
ncbi:MAG: 16S rRNA (cytosine(1402)-N(4))-methyltransferase RsmH [Alphaproteobacteria bacterium]|nr:16S rRNA (cytosine(1402)-N(4))-methyltransferase RsmH [Alphaproteobacteria bacterium]